MHDAWVGGQMLADSGGSIRQNGAIQEGGVRLWAQPLRRQHAVPEVNAAGHHIVSAGRRGRRTVGRCHGQERTAAATPATRPPPTAAHTRRTARPTHVQICCTPCLPYRRCHSSGGQRLRLYCASSHRAHTTALRPMLLPSGCSGSTAMNLWQAGGRGVAGWGDP